MAIQRLRRIFDFFRTLVFLSALAFAVAWLANNASTDLVGYPKVLDGDSLVLDGIEIRLEGIDAPEYDQLCENNNGQFRCGQSSKKHLETLLGGLQITCVGWQTDKYDRLLATCKHGDFELNQRMVEDGWAIAYGAYEAAEKNARNNKTGLWAGGFQSPAAWRKEKQESGILGWLGGFRFW